MIQGLSFPNIHQQTRQKEMHRHWTELGRCTQHRSVTWNGSQEDTAFYMFVDILIALRF